MEFNDRVNAATNSLARGSTAICSMLVRMPEQSGMLVGRYQLYDEIAAGGMATVHIGRLLGPIGFSRTVAIKRLHAALAKDPEFVAAFLDEARLAARVRHPNVAATLDVVARSGEIFLVMEYVQGEPLSRLRRALNGPVPVDIALGIAAGMLAGLHAAHEARSERGEPLHIVHRDVSPQNVMVGTDGGVRVLDFGIAKAAHRVQTTREGQLKGKLAYMAPEQVQMRTIDRRTDVFSAGVVLWEMLTGRRLFAAPEPAAVVANIVLGDVEPPSHIVPELPAQLDEIVLKALALDPAKRFATCRDFAVALEGVMAAAPARQIGEWVEKLAGDTLTARAQRIHSIESSTDHAMALPAQPGLTAKSADAATEVSRSLLASEPESPSQVTDLSIATGSEAIQASRSRRPIVLLVTAIAFVGVAVAAAVVLWTRTQRASPDTPALAQASSSVSQPGVAPSASEIAEPAPPPTRSSDVGSAKSAPAPIQRAPAKKAPKPGCNPPYTVDEKGHRFYKPECFK